MDTAKPPSEVHSTLEAFVIGFILAFIAGFVALPFIRLGSFYVFVVVFAAYLIYALYVPSPKPGVSAVMVATPSRKLVSINAGKVSAYEEKKYKLGRTKPERVSLKAYIHTKSNRNVLIKWKSFKKIAQIKPDVAIGIAGESALDLNIERAEKYRKYLNSELYVISLKQRKYQKFERQIK
ncbi:MAG: hypothetical protein QXV17_09575 [Candidatus Micrarchaeaceae archaeon]